MLRKVKGISVRFDKSRKRWRVCFEIKKQTWFIPCQDKQVANRIAQECGQRLLRGEDIRPSHLREVPVARTGSQPGTVRAEGNEWLIARQRQRGRKTNAFYKTNLVEHIYPVLGDLRVTADELNREQCLGFAHSLVGKISARTGKPLRHDTRLGIIATLSAFCQWARDKHPKTFGTNPADRLVDYLVDADEAPTKMLVWTWDQVERLLATTKARAPFWYPLLAFAIKTGLRSGELIEAQWEQDFATPGFIHVQRQYLWDDRKTYAVDAQGCLSASADPHASHVVPTKGRDLRLVPLGADLEAILVEHRAVQRAYAFKHGHPQSTLLFTAPRGGRVRPRLFAQRILPQLCAWANVPPTTRMHTTRHTFATVLLFGGVRVDDVSEWLGHDDTATTEKHYKHWIRDTRREQALAQQVAAVWGGK